MPVNMPATAANQGLDKEEGFRWSGDFVLGAAATLAIVMLVWAVM